MNKNLTVLRALALSLLITLMGSSAVAKEYYNDDMCERECCDSTPLDCGAWNVKVRAGIAPTIFTGREAVYGVSCANSGRGGTMPSTNPVLEFSKMPKFNDLFSTPGFTIAGEIAHAITDCHETFLEVAWRRYSGKDYTATDTLISRTAEPAARIVLGLENVAADATTGQPALNNDIDNYSAIGGYAGMRHYFGRYWCDRLAVFVGAKVGILHRKEVDTNLRLTQTSGAFPGTLTQPQSVSVEKKDDGSTALFRKQNTISGGPQVGFTFCFWKQLSFIMTAEFIASGAFKSNRNFVLPEISPTMVNRTNFSNVLFGNTGVEMTFPITFGLMWEF